MKRRDKEGAYSGRTKLSTTIATPVSHFLGSEARRSGRPLGRVIDEMIAQVQRLRLEEELARGYELMNRENLEFAELAMSAQAEVLERRAATKKRRTVLGRLQPRARK